MNVRLFVSVSSVLLCLWLGATYVRVVPMDTYGSDGRAPEAPPVVQIETPSAGEDSAVAVR